MEEGGCSGTHSSTRMSRDSDSSCKSGLVLKGLDHQMIKFFNLDCMTFKCSDSLQISGNGL